MCYPCRSMSLSFNWMQDMWQETPSPNASETTSLCHYYAPQQSKPRYFGKVISAGKLCLEQEIVFYFFCKNAMLQPALRTGWILWSLTLSMEAEVLCYSTHTKKEKAKLSKWPSDSRAVGPLTIPRDKKNFKKSTIVLVLHYVNTKIPVCKHRERISRKLGGVFKVCIWNELSQKCKNS